jgi:hypothetical protein
VTFDRPWNANAIQNPLSGLKHLKGFGRGYTERHAKLYADMLLEFAINRRQNQTRSWKSARVKIMHVHSAVLRGRLMQ